MERKLAIRGGYVMTMDAGRTTYERGVVVCAGPRVVSVGPDTGQDLGGVETIDASGCVVMPGLVNAHTHLYAMFGRSLSFDQLFPQWLATQKGIIAQFTRDDHVVVRNGRLAVADEHEILGRATRRARELAKRAS